MRWRRRIHGLSGFPPIVKVTRWKTSPAARARKRAHYRRQCQRDAIRFYAIPLGDAVIAELYRALGTDVLDRRSLILELARVLREALTKEIKSDASESSAKNPRMLCPGLDRHHDKTSSINATRSLPGNRRTGSLLRRHR
jgi:hypothetical protein